MDEAYHPGMLKVSPNSGFQTFKKKIVMENDQMNSGNPEDKKNSQDSHEKTQQEKKEMTGNS